MEKTVRKYPEWFGDDDDLKREGQWSRLSMVVAYIVFGFIVVLLLIAYILPSTKVLEVAALVVSATWTFRNSGRIWNFGIGLKRHFRTNAFFDFTNELPSLITPALAVLLAITVANPEDKIIESGFFGNVKDKIDSFEFFLAGGSEPLSKEDIEAVVRPIVKEEIGTLTFGGGGGPGVVSVERFVMFPDSGSDSLVQFFGNAIFPLRFTNAQVKSAPPEGANFDVEDVDWEPGAGGGTELTTDHVNDLKELIKIIAPCTVKPVSLRVSGFASSLRFKDFQLKETSNKLNNAAANLRAEAVFKRLKSLKDEFEAADTENLFNPSNLDIEIHRHEDFAEMISHRPFNDRPGEIRENESEGLNRSAFIRIGAIGACEVGE